MSDYLNIKVRLPQEMALEMIARILATRPWWDPEVTEDGLCLWRPLVLGGMDSELKVVEEACQAVEQRRAGAGFRASDNAGANDNTGANDNAGTNDNTGARVYESQLVLSVTRQDCAQIIWPPLPAALGPWAIIPLEAGQKILPAEDGTLRWPPFLRPSRRLWAGADLATTMIREHLDPPPGAPETRGRPTLVLEAGAPPLSLVASLAETGSGGHIVSLVADEGTCAAAQALFGANGRLVHLQTFKSLLKSLKTLVARQSQWAGHFGLIVVHLSPYLAVRHLKILASWLSPTGAIIIAGFAPGRETAYLLRAAARAGLNLSTSIVKDDWAALKLLPAPCRPELPPLTGSLVPDLVELPEPEKLLDQENLSPNSTTPEDSTSEDSNSGNYVKKKSSLENTILELPSPEYFVLEDFDGEDCDPSENPLEEEPSLILEDDESDDSGDE